MRARRKRDLRASESVDWRRYQNQTAALFRRLGCEVSVEAIVSGVRARHKIDVWVRFRKFGIETTWVVECKHWNTAVTKEKVLTLRSVVEDVGADRGILVSSAGFQSGAVRAASKTNVTLTGLEELKQTTQKDLVLSVLSRMETRVIELRHSLRGLYQSERMGPNMITSTPRPGVDGRAVIEGIGRLAFLKDGFECIRLGKPPYPVRYDDASKCMISADTLEEFVSHSARIIQEIQKMLVSQTAVNRSGD